MTIGINTEEIMESVGSFSEEIMGRVDSVQVICTILERDGSTSLLTHGLGNIHSRISSADTWLVQARKAVSE